MQPGVIALHRYHGWFWKVWNLLFQRHDGFWTSAKKKGGIESKENLYRNSELGLRTENWSPAIWGNSGDYYLIVEIQWTSINGRRWPWKTPFPRSSPSFLENSVFRGNTILLCQVIKIIFKNLLNTWSMQTFQALCG